MRASSIRKGTDPAPPLIPFMAYVSSRPDNPSIRFLGRACAESVFRRRLAPGNTERGILSPGARRGPHTSRVQNLINKGKNHP